MYSELDKINNLVLTGLDHCYHFKWNKAESTFKQVIEKYPNDPQGYHYLSSVYFWYYLSNKNEDDLSSFKKFSDEAIDKASCHASFVAD